jgi:putative nucleotidyltransferase with HDIG domain
MRMGASDYILKPFEIRDLAAKVDKVLAERKIRSEQKKISNLMKVFALTNILRSQQNIRSLVREFLVHVRETFVPDSLSMYFVGGDGESPAKRIVWGPTLQDNLELRRWFKNLSLKLLERDKPKLLDPVTLRRVQRTSQAGPNDLTEYSAMIVPVTGSIHKTGVLILVRHKDKPHYDLSDLQLLSVFAAHAASSFENLKAYRRLQAINREIVTSYVSAVEAKDVYTHGHSDRVSRYAVLLGRELGLDKHDLEILAFAGILHDIGKIGISDALLNKSGPLTEDELEVMKQHPVVGRDILSRVTSFSEIMSIVYHHHERFDGHGYPEGLAGRDIPYLSRIISVIDGYEAMTSDRAYQKARPVREVKEIMAEGAGTQWDPELVEAWFRILDTYDLTRDRPSTPLDPVLRAV